MSAIDTALDRIIAEKNDAIAKMEWWRKEAERWRAQALDLDAQVESAIASMTTRMDRIERQLKQFTDIDLQGCVQRHNRSCRGVADHL